MSRQSRTYQSLLTVIRTQSPLVCFFVLFFVVQPAFAVEWSTMEGAKEGGSWFQATFFALCGVAALGALGFSSFHICRIMRWMPREKEFQVSRSLQTTFGALFIMAATLPYLFINAPLIALGIFVCVIGSGFIAYLSSCEATAVDMDEPLID